MGGSWLGVVGGAIWLRLWFALIYRGSGLEGSEAALQAAVAGGSGILFSGGGWRGEEGGKVLVWVWGFELGLW